MSEIRSCCFAMVIFLLSVSGAAAQLPPPVFLPPAPILNPSSSLVLPPLQQVPVSPAPGGGLGGGHTLLRQYPAPCSVFSRHPCDPSVCDVFHHGPCIPYYLPPIGQDLRLTIVSTDTDAPPAENSSDDGHALASIRDMFAAFRACWVPPPKAEAHHGMEYTVRFALKRDGSMMGPPRMTYASHGVPAAMREVYRDAIDSALQRCTPLHLTDGMGGAVAGRPIAIRFVDDRTIDGQVSPR